MKRIIGGLVLAALASSAYAANPCDRYETAPKGAREYGRYGTTCTTDTDCLNYCLASARDKKQTEACIADSGYGQGEGLDWIKSAPGPVRDEARNCEWKAVR